MFGWGKPQDPASRVAELEARFPMPAAELRCLQRRIKPGGILCGGDWRPDPRAVQDFIRDSGCEGMAAGPPVNGPCAAPPTARHETPSPR